MHLSTNIGRVTVLGTGLLIGVAGSATAPACILQDYCILVNTWGTDWCMHVDGAWMWPVEQPELAERVSAGRGGPPEGCRCFNDAEVKLLHTQAPIEQYEQLIAQLEQNARNECAWAVPPGYDHSCYLEEGPLAPALSVPYFGESTNDCVGSCAYIKPPPWGSCGADPNPWECNGVDSSTEGSDSGGSGTTDSSDSETAGSEPEIDPPITLGTEVAQ